MRAPAFSGPSNSIAMIPTGEMGWPYYVVCALFFLLCGLFCGYLIWRRGHLQTQDAEAEVARTAKDLDALKEDLRNEESLLRTDDEGEENEKAVSSSRKA